MSSYVEARVGISASKVEKPIAIKREHRDYRAKTAQLRDRFRHAAEVRERLHLMSEMELTAVDELRAFLRAHQKSTFLLT
jgi:hypothetical protein